MKSVSSSVRFTEEETRSLFQGVKLALGFDSQTSIDEKTCFEYLAERVAVKFNCRVKSTYRLRGGTPADVAYFFRRGLFGLQEVGRFVVVHDFNCLIVNFNGAKEVGVDLISSMRIIVAGQDNKIAN